MIQLVTEKRYKLSIDRIPELKYITNYYTYKCQQFIESYQKAGFTKCMVYHIFQHIIDGKKRIRARLLV